MKLNKHEKSILKDLREGEPFSYRMRDGELFIGVRMNIDKKYDEYEIFRCFDYKKIKDGIIKLKKKSSK